MKSHNISAFIFEHQIISHCIPISLNLSQTEREATKSPKLNFAICEEKTHMQVETIVHEKVEAEGERDMLKKRLKDLKKNQEGGEGRRLTRSIKEKNSEIDTLKMKIEGLEDRAREVLSRESALMKYNRNLEYKNGQLESRMKAKDEFNVRYINRTMATEMLLEDSNFGPNVEELEDQMEKEIIEFERDSLALHDENVTLRILYTSLKSRARELVEEQKKMPHPALLRDTLSTFTSAERHAIPKEPQPSLTLTPAPVTEECPICLADIFAAPTAVLNPCGHFFHVPCVANLNADKTCPTCCLPYTHFNMVE